MSNKHKTNQLNGTALEYMTKVLKLKKHCPRRACTGTMVEIWTQYKNHGTINIEQECTSCGKVIKDPRFKKEREERWRNRKNKNNYKKRN